MPDKSARERRFNRFRLTAEPRLRLILKEKAKKEEGKYLNEKFLVLNTKEVEDKRALICLEFKEVFKLVPLNASYPFFCGLIKQHVPLERTSFF